MQLFARTSRVGRVQSSRAPVTPVRAPVYRRSAHAVKAAEAEAEPEAAEAAASELELSTMDRARLALQEESVDKEVLTGCLEDLQAELESLRTSAATAEARLTQVESSMAAAKDQFVRLNADFDNFRRRTTEEKAALQDSVKSDVVKELLPLIDNFELARTNVKAETEQELKINNSYQSLYKQMVDIIRALGVEAVPTTGTPFDPSIHDGIMREPSSEHPDGTVLMEFRKGFRIKDRLLRPAMVKVSFSEDGPVASSEE